MFQSSYKHWAPLSRVFWENFMGSFTQKKRSLSSDLWEIIYVIDQAAAQEQLMCIFLRVYRGAIYLWKRLNFLCTIMADPDWAENSGIFNHNSTLQLPGYIFPLFGPIFRSLTGWRLWMKPEGGKAALQTQLLSATGATEPSGVQLTRHLSGYSSAFTPQAACQQTACYHFPPLHICVPF